MTFRSRAVPAFWEHYDLLPEDIQILAAKQYTLFSRDPWHPSLHFKQVGKFWPVRVSHFYRALAVRDGNVLIWFSIGTHADYDRLLTSGK